MSYSPPLDQRIVDEYFSLAAQRNTRHVAWLFGMVATFGLSPDQLWNEVLVKWQDNSLVLATRKRPIKPFHPQWVTLFQLKEKQPKNYLDCYGKIKNDLYCAIAHQRITLNITDLLLAHRVRKSYYKPKPPVAPARVLEVVS